MQTGRAPSQPGNMQLPQVGRVLPGPAGKLQELAAAGALQQATPEMLGLKASSMAVMSPSQAINQHDVAFLSSSWASAKAAAAEDEVIAGPLRSIKSAKEMGVGKVSRMLVVLSSFHPSGAGSAFSKVKDPSGMMGAAIHSSALQQQQQQQPLGPGCVLLLQNVSVLTPNPGSGYLAVTADNIVQAWPADQPGRNIRHTAHQPAANQQQQQQQQPVEQQEQRQPPAPSQQQRQQQHPGPAAVGQGAAAAGAAASGAGSRQTNSFFPPPSPDIMSVLNEMAGRGSAAAAGQGQPNSRHNPQHSQQQQQQQDGRQAPYGIRPGYMGPPYNSQTQQQQQQQQQKRTQQWQQEKQQGSEQQGEFSPAVSGVAAQQQQQQQQAGAHHIRSSMPPPPPRTLGPAGSQQGWQQQQQQQQQQQRSTQQTASQQQQYQQRHVLGTPGPQHGQQRQQHSQGLHSQGEQQQQQQFMPPSIFQGLSQPQQPTGSLSQGGSPAVPPPAAAAVTGLGMPPGRDRGVLEGAGMRGAAAQLQGQLAGASQLQQGRQGGHGAASGPTVTQGSPMPPAAAMQGGSSLHTGRQTAAGCSGSSSSQWQGSLGQNKSLAGGRASVAGAGAGVGAAGAACDMDEDVEFDENVVAAIFGSQVGTVALTAGQQQQQQRQQLSSVTGTFRSAAQDTPAGAAADVPSSKPSAAGKQQQLAQRTPQISSLQQSQPNASKLQGSSGPPTTLMPPRAPLAKPAEQQAARGTYNAAGLQPPTAPPSQPYQQGQQQWSLQGSMRPPVQQWGLPGRSAVSQGQVGAAGVGFGASLLGKRPAVSLLDDLVADDLDEL